MAWIAMCDVALIAAVPWSRRSVRALLQRGGRAIRRIPLFFAVSLAVLAGIALVFIAFWVLKHIIDTSTQEAAPIDLTKIALTLVAGIGGTVALVVAYRRQRDLEQGRFVERFGAAAAQLGHPDVAVRIAGVYAMSGVADETSGQRRQQCIDVLCGYLRLPYDPDHGANHQTEQPNSSPKPPDKAANDRS